jgi:Fic family protein
MAIGRGWLQYFLNGVARQSEDALKRAERANKLLERWRSKLAGAAHAQVAFQLVDLLGANPFLTPRGAQQRLDVAYNTVTRAIRHCRNRALSRRSAEQDATEFTAQETAADLRRTSTVKTGGRVLA